MGILMAEMMTEFASMPWDYKKLDDDFVDFFKNRIDQNLSVIDLGCGSGSQSWQLEQLGFDVTATDNKNVLQHDIKKFILDDALDSKLNKKYDIIIDRALIHGLWTDKNKHKYFEMINNITHDKSIILLKVMSQYEVRFNNIGGPYRFTEEQLTKLYSGLNFKCVKLIDTYIYSNNIQPYLRGYFSIYKKEGIPE
jgi:cyclopropane fatty-acyl-phospholipid synthase-like methyltransferase